MIDLSKLSQVEKDKIFKFISTEHKTYLQAIKKIRDDWKTIVIQTPPQIRLIPLIITALSVNRLGFFIHYNTGRTTMKSFN